MKIKNWFLLVIASFGFGVGSFIVGLGIGTLITEINPPSEPIYYCNPSTTSKRARMVENCISKNELSIFECDDLSRKMYGIAGFKRDGRILPCLEAESQSEKKTCGDVT